MYNSFENVFTILSKMYLQIDPKGITCFEKGCWEKLKNRWSASNNFQINLKSTNQKMAF